MTGGGGHMRLDPLFTDHMVLEAHKPIRIFGAGSGHVRVRIEGDTAEADAPGPDWCVTLPARSPGGPYAVEIDLSGQKISLQDVYVGDVYLLAGQSNMQFKLSESSCPRDAWRDRPLLRAFSLSRPEPGEPFTPEDGWQVCARDNAGGISAIGYHLGELCEGGRAVGIIQCYQGASIIESWLPQSLADQPEFAVPIEDKHIDHTWPDYGVFNRSGYLYDHMFMKLPPLSIGAVVWYQGESDTTPAEARIYDKELSALIARWRDDLHDPFLPFVIVQIADYDQRNDEGWRALQAAQKKAAASIPGAYLAVSRDVCESDRIHPPTKQRLSRRIADILKSLRACP